MSDIEEKEKDNGYDEGMEQGGTKHVSHLTSVPFSGEFDNHQSHQLKDANKNITKATMHDNSGSSYFYTNTTTDTTCATSMLQNTKMSRNDYENIYYQKGNGV